MKSPLSRLVFLCGLLTVAAQPSRGSLRIVEETSLSQGMVNGRMVVFDSDHNRRAELLLGTYFRDISRIGLGFFEWTAPAAFTFVYGDTGTASPQGIVTGDLNPSSAGYLDSDGLTDLVGTNGEVLQQPPVLYLVICQHESQSCSMYPETLVWCARYDTNAALSEDAYLTDLDRDGRSEILIQKDRILVFENVTDDSCRLAAALPRPRNRIVSTFAIGDLDGDGRTEFAGAGGGRSFVWIWECVGNDAYELADSLPFDKPNGHDIWYGPDVDQNGRPEFFVGFAELDDAWTMYLYQIEATGNDTYDTTFIDTAHAYTTDWSRQSACGDVDGDGIEEVVWSVGTHLHYYKALGPHQYERVASWRNQAGNCADIAIYDINNDGYNEVISSGNNLSFVIAVQAVRVRAPNGGEALTPGESTSIVWQKFEPPRCDSFSLFLSLDNGASYDTLATGLPPGDTAWPWIVPATPSDSCLVKVVAYGPGWRSDVSDRVFRILPSAVSEAPRGRSRAFGLVVCPNPTTREAYITFGPQDERGTSLAIYDPSGRLVRDLTEAARSSFGSVCWDGQDAYGHRVTSGVYLVRLTGLSRSLTQKLVVR